MEKEKVIYYLNKFDYRHYVLNDTIEVMIESGHQVIINFEDHDKIKVKDKLIPWNYVTGNIKMTLKGSILYNSIGMFILGLICFSSSDKENASLLILLFMLCATIIILFTIHYIIKLENFKNQLTIWIKE